jgi:hypothetical protein
MRRFVGAATIAVGLFLIAVPFATDLFDRTRGADRTFDAMHDFVSEPGIALARRNFGTVAAAGQELNGELIPGLGRRLDVTPERFKAQIGRDYPDVATASERIPGYLMFVGPTIDALDEGRDEFEAGEALPGAALPITSAPWLFLVLGGLVAGAGVLVLRTPGKTGLTAVAVLGAAAVALPLALSIPSKASDARAVGDIARGGLSQQGADTAEEIVVVLDKMVRQVRGEMVPDLARGLGVTPSEVEAEIARDYPDVALLLARWEAIAAGRRIRASATTLTASTRAVPPRLRATASPQFVGR